MNKKILIGSILAVFFMISLPTVNAVVCNFTWFPKQPREGQLVYFMDLSSDEDGDIEHYKWYFDNEGGKQGKNMFHRFDSKGEHEVMHVVECSDGDRDTKRCTLFVTESKSKSKVISNPLYVFLESLLMSHTLLLRLLFKI